MKCIRCCMTIPELPEDAKKEEMLCDKCYELEEKEYKQNNNN